MDEMKSQKVKLIAAAFLCVIVAACGGKRDDAAELLNQCETAIGASQYSQALELLDTLNARYPEQVEIRQQGLLLRARAMEGIAIDSIQAADVELAQATIAVDSLSSLFKHVDAPTQGMDGYYVPRDATAGLMTATGLRGRVNEDGYMQLDVNVQGRKIGLKGVHFKTGDDVWTSGTVSSAGLVSVGGNESITLRQELIPDMASWLRSHNDVKIVYRGSQGEVSLNMTASTRSELLACSDYAHALQAKRRADIHREKYERMLQTARDQIANLTPAE